MLLELELPALLLACAGERKEDSKEGRMQLIGRVKQVQELSPTPSTDKEPQHDQEPGGCLEFVWSPRPKQELWLSFGSAFMCTRTYTCIHVHANIHIQMHMGLLGLS